MLRFIAVILLAVQIVSIGLPSVSAAEWVNPLTKFVVTAYYSPLPDQSFYLRGSYEADIALNGRGTHGASGKAVYAGMLAGPKSYAFGTKIYLDGLGVGSIDDRGGAIVSSGSRGYDADRIDIWVGQGEEGLKRALTWGKRTVVGRIVNEADFNADDLIRIENFPIAKIDKRPYIAQKSNTPTDPAPTVGVLDEFSAPITRSSPAEMIRKVQTMLKDLGYYDGEIDAVFSKKIEQALYDFQIANKLVRSQKDLGAGYYGVQTRAKMHEVYAHYQLAEQTRKEEEARLALAQKKQEELLVAQKKEVSLFVESLGTPKEQEVGAHVRKLQLSLKALGYFSGKDTAIFGPATKRALVAYQSDRAIEKSELGKLGQSTRVALAADLLQIRLKERGKEVAYMKND